MFCWDDFIVMAVRVIKSDCYFIGIAIIMILQNGINFRSFAEQKSFSFDLDISLSSSSGVSNLGFSGNDNYYNFFKFENGRLFDPLNRFVYNYSKDETINISGNFSSGVFGYYINQNLIAVNLPISDSAKSFDHFLLSTQSAVADFNVDINATIGNLLKYFPETLLLIILVINLRLILIT